jgi:CheY-like chemotaxis protein
VRELACEFLKSSGYSVLDAANGLEALEIAKINARGLDLVLSDVMMPKMTGTVLAERLKRILPDVPVLLMSGFAEYSGISESGSRTMAVIQKPFSHSSLVEKVRDALDRKIARDVAVSAGQGLADRK